MGAVSLDAARIRNPALMCNRYGYLHPYHELVEEFSQTRIFFEFTGSKYPKTKWRFSRPGDTIFCIAGLWRPGEAGEAYTMLTVDPGPDVAPYHDRQVVVLAREQWADWLTGPEPERLLQPAPAGFLKVVQDAGPAKPDEAARTLL